MNGGKVGDDALIHATSAAEREQYAAENMFTVTEAVGLVGKYFPELSPYLQISSEPSPSSGSWHWDETNSAIQLDRRVLSGEILLDTTAASVLVGHEAVHGWVFGIDPSYTSRAWSQDRFARMDPPGGRPHLWVENKGTQIGIWATQMTHFGSGPKLTASSYWSCVGGGDCK
jgi:hypothetical protein